MQTILRAACVFATAVLVGSSAAAQDTKPFTPEGDARYYDFWIGTWQQVRNGKVDPSGTTFVVTRSVNGAAMREDWRMVMDSTSKLAATALRAWDKTNARWMYTWVSENGLYQVWEGRKVGSDWYIYKHFDINGDKYLSRQGWIPAGENRITRVSEKSYDEGVTWQLRFRETYERVGGAPAPSNTGSPPSPESAPDPTFHP